MKVKIYGARESMKTVQHAEGTAQTVDTLLEVNGSPMIAYADMAANEQGSYIYAAENVEGDKAAVAFTEGGAVYYDAGNDVFTNTDNTGANKLCGIAKEAAAGGDATVVIDFNASLGL